MIQEFRVDKHRLLFDLQPELFMSDRNLLWYAQNRQLPEPEVISVMLRALKPGDCAVDAGANVGFFTVLMSKIVGERGTVIAVEPDSINCDKLKKNLDINSCTNVDLWEAPLHKHEDGLVGFMRHSDNGQSHVTNDGPIKLQTETLDAIIGPTRRPSLLKIDIEGSEVDALLGCTFDFPCIVTEVNTAALARAGRTPVELFTIMRERGYHRYQLHADGSMPSRLEYSQTVKLTRDNANMLFAPRDYVAKSLWPEVVI